ncbi:MAG: transcription termination/antitermination protein NusG [Patescibacteria group bacterium]
MTKDKTKETDVTQPEVGNTESEKNEKIENEVAAEAVPASPKKKLLTLKQSGERNWYVIHTYAGYEEQVADSLKQRIESLSMQDKIFDVIVPKEKQIEIKNGKRTTIEKRIFPGYVLVDMIVTDDSWYVVRNTPNVTGFIGFGVRPTPMSKEEIDRIKKRMGVEEPKFKVDFKEGDLVKITDGALKGFEGKIEEVDQDKGKVKVLVNMFGRETPVTLDFLQAKKV